MILLMTEESLEIHDHRPPRPAHRPPRPEVLPSLLLSLAQGPFSPGTLSSDFPSSCSAAHLFLLHCKKIVLVNVPMPCTLPTRCGFSDSSFLTFFVTDNYSAALLRWHCWFFLLSLTSDRWHAPGLSSSLSTLDPETPLQPRGFKQCPHTEGSQVYNSAHSFALNPSRKYPFNSLMASQS